MIIASSRRFSWPLLAATAVLLAPWATAQSSRTRVPVRANRASAAPIRANANSVPSVELGELQSQGIDLPEAVALGEGELRELQGPEATLLPLPVKQPAGAVRSSSADQRGAVAKGIGKASVVRPEDLVDAVGDGRIRFDRAARGTADLAAEKEPVRILFATDGRALGLSRYIRERDERAKLAERVGIPAGRAFKSVAAAGFLTLLGTGVALAAEPVAIAATPVFMSVPALIGAAAVFVIPPAVIATLPPQIMGVVQTRIYKEIKTLRELVGYYSYSTYDSLPEQTLVHHYELLYRTAKTRYPKGTGLINKRDIFAGLKDPAEIKIPGTDHKEDREKALRELRGYIEDLDQRLKERDTNRSSDLSNINYAIALILGLIASVLQFKGIMALDPSMPSIFSMLLTSVSVGAGAGYLWYRSRPAPPEDRTVGGPKSG